jgi:hypothetical protein
MNAMIRSRRPVLALVVSLGAALVSTLAGCTGVPASPAPAVLADNITGNLAQADHLDSTDGFLRVSGRTGLILSMRPMAAPPAAPEGWAFTGPVFDITAQDGQRRPVQQLASLLMLRFNVRGDDRPLTVMVYRDGAWQVVESERDDEGHLVAQVDHLTPYTVAAPAPRVPAGARPTTAAPSSRTRPTGMPTIQVTPSARRTPSATTSVSTVAASDAQSVLAAAAKTLKGKPVKVTSAMGYTGSLSVPVPTALQGSLGVAISAGGAGYYGMYSGVNQVVVVQAAGGNANGSLTLLAEPKTAMPADAAAAQSQLKTLFPGVSASLTPVQAAPSGYAFYGVSGSTAYAVGYIQYEGLVLAYAMSGSGSYQALVPQQ